MKTPYAVVIECPEGPAVVKTLGVANLLLVLNLLSHSDLLSGPRLCGCHFPAFYRHFHVRASHRPHKSKPNHPEEVPQWRWRSLMLPSQGPVNGGGVNAGGSRSGLNYPSFFVLFETFPIVPEFPDFFRDFPHLSFPLSRPVKAYTRNIHKKWETPRFGDPLVYLLS